MKNFLNMCGTIIRSVSLWLKQYPWLEALFQVSVTVLFGLGLIFAAALSSLQKFSFNDLLDTFLSYFSGGELGLAIAATIGAILHLVFTKFGASSQKSSFFLLLVTVLPLVVTFLFVGSNPGFDKNGLEPFKLVVLWLMYGLVHVVWYFVLIIEGKQPGIEPLERAQDEKSSVNRITSDKSRVG